MRHRAATATLVAVSLSTVLAARAPQQQKTALVTAVAEASGKLGDLKAADFVVKEDGATRDVVNAAPSTEPLFITLLVDTVAPPMGGLPRANISLTTTQDLRRGLTSFVTTIKAGNPDAQIAVLEYTGAATTVLDFTAEATAVDRYVQRLFPNRQADGVVIEAIVEGAKKLSDKPSPRRAIVSVDFNSRDSSAVQAMNQAAEHVHKSGATVWTISVRGTSATSSNREEVLNVVTKGSGGMRLTVVEATGLEAMLKTVANSLLSQYNVTFVRPGSGAVKRTEMQTKSGGKVLMTPWMR